MKEISNENEIFRPVGCRRHGADGWLQPGGEGRRPHALAEQIDSLLPTTDADLLNRAFLAGELPLTDYLLEQSLQTSARIRLLATLRDLHLIIAELNAYKL